MLVMGPDTVFPAWMVSEEARELLPFLQLGVDVQACAKVGATGQVGVCLVDLSRALFLSLLYMFFYYLYSSFLFKGLRKTPVTAESIRRFIDSSSARRAGRGRGVGGSLL